MRPWTLAWQDALYGARGFYRMPTGPAGHFATSCHGPRAVPFAEALLRLATAESVGRIIDIGAGRGELLSAIAGLAGGAEGAGIDLVGVDVVARPAGLATRIDWIESPGGAELPDLGRPEAALVVANEWLDVIPCPILEADGAGELREVEVDDSGQERLGVLAGESATVGAAEVAWVQRWWPGPFQPGDRVEVGMPRDQALASLQQAVGSGVVLAVDYGHTRTSRPAGGTLTGYRQGRQVAPRPDASCDLTAHVAVDSLPHDRLMTQRDALRELGIRGEHAAYDLARSDPIAYLRALERRGAVAELTGAGLGDFWWVLSRVG
jgi:SAM-dependent MidA family methyltransferase